MEKTTQNKNILKNSTTKKETTKESPTNTETKNSFTKSKNIESKQSKTVKQPKVANKTTKLPNKPAKDKNVSPIVEKINNYFSKPKTDMKRKYKLVDEMIDNGVFTTQIENPIIRNEVESIFYNISLINDLNIKASNFKNNYKNSQQKNNSNHKEAINNCLSSLSEFKNDFMTTLATDEMKSLFSYQVYVDNVKDVIANTVKDVISETFANLNMTPDSEISPEDAQALKSEIDNFKDTLTAFIVLKQVKEFEDVSVKSGNYHNTKNQDDKEYRTSKGYDYDWSTYIKPALEKTTKENVDKVDIDNFINKHLDKIGESLKNYTSNINISNIVSDSIFNQDELEIFVDGIKINSNNIEITSQFNSEIQTSNDKEMIVSDRNLQFANINKEDNSNLFSEFTDYTVSNDTPIQENSENKDDEDENVVNQNTQLSQSQPNLSPDNIVLPFKPVQKSDNNVKSGDNNKSDDNAKSDGSKDGENKEEKKEEEKIKTNLVEKVIIGALTIAQLIAKGFVGIIKLPIKMLSKGIVEGHRYILDTSTKSKIDIGSEKQGFVSTSSTPDSNISTESEKTQTSSQKNIQPNSGIYTSTNSNNSNQEVSANESIENQENIQESNVQEEITSLEGKAEANLIEEPEKIEEKIDKTTTEEIEKQENVQEQQSNSLEGKDEPNLIEAPEKIKENDDDTTTEEIEKQENVQEETNLIEEPVKIKENIDNVTAEKTEIKEESENSPKVEKIITEEILEANEEIKNDPKVEKVIQEEIEKIRAEFETQIAEDVKNKIETNKNSQEFDDFNNNYGYEFKDHRTKLQKFVDKGVGFISSVFDIDYNYDPTTDTSGNKIYKSIDKLGEKTIQFAKFTKDKAIKLAKLSKEKTISIVSKIKEKIDNAKKEKAEKQATKQNENIEKTPEVKSNFAQTVEENQVENNEQTVESTKEKVETAIINEITQDSVDVKADLNNTVENLENENTVEDAENNISDETTELKDYINNVYESNLYKKIEKVEIFNNIPNVKNYLDEEQLDFYNTNTKLIKELNDFELNKITVDQLSNEFLLDEEYYEYANLHILGDAKKDYNEYEADTKLLKERLKQAKKENSKFYKFTNSIKNKVGTLKSKAVELGKHIKDGTKKLTHTLLQTTAKTAIAAYAFSNVAGAGTATVIKSVVEKGVEMYEENHKPTAEAMNAAEEIFKNNKLNIEQKFEALKPIKNQLNVDQKERFDSISNNMKEVNKFKKDKISVNELSSDVCMSKQFVDYLTDYISTEEYSKDESKRLKDMQIVINKHKSANLIYNNYDFNKNLSAEEKDELYENRNKLIDAINNSEFSEIQKSIYLTKINLDKQEVGAYEWAKYKLNVAQTKNLIEYSKNDNENNKENKILLPQFKEMYKETYDKYGSFEKDDGSKVKLPHLESLFGLAKTIAVYKIKDSIISNGIDKDGVLEKEIVEKLKEGIVNAKEKFDNTLNKDEILKNQDLEIEKEI